MYDDDQKPYHVAEQDVRYAVLDDQNREILVCADRRSAEHYVGLLTAAYRRGYRAGHRDARSE
jgi:hypothetical protein